MDKKNYAKVHSIETFGTVDGPGVRFVVFLQGCHLQCKYCHNRDTWDMNSDTSSYMSVDELVTQILKYRPYIMPNGGVTVTGGEPLLQPHFIISLFQRLKALGIHTAIDTSGMVELTDTIREVLSLTDLVLLDIKHIDSKKCKELVGFGNEKELTFAKYLSESGIPMWIRQVLVPGYTDSEEDLLQLKALIASLKTVQKVELLPYHDLGKYKWEALQLDYPLSHVKQASTDDIKRAKKILGI